jgi:hypothetical protein
MIRGSLFTRFYLEDGIRETEAYRALAPLDLAAFTARASALWSELAAMKRPSEAETEHDFIFPLLDHLGWHSLTQQDPNRSRRDIADALLFRDDATKTQARRLQHTERFRLGAVVVENEARDTRLDRGTGSTEAPSSQILRYLSRAESQSSGAIAWGLLTNFHYWRLYWAHAPRRDEGFIEFDLPSLFGTLPPASPAGAPDDHWLRVFLLLFRVQAHAPQPPQSRTFLDDALAEGRRYEARVTEHLSRTIFDQVFPAIVAAIATNDPAANTADPAWRGEAREAALRLLYRLLFLLYAEDRDLLPVNAPAYQPYSLKALRDQAAAATDGNRTLSARGKGWWAKLRTLFDAINEGDPALGLPPYNGGLFHDDPGSLLTRLAIPDATLAPLIDAMSREGAALARRWINYRDLSVQQLGAIYERLLERDVAPDPQAHSGVSLRPNQFARRTTGSYYTPDELVQLMLRRTVGPLLAERRAAFAQAAEALAADKRPRAERLAQLARHDPAEAYLALRICDPAMGSGHFLVSLVDYLGAETLNVIAATGSQAGWAENYRSPVMAQIEAIRAEILAQAKLHRWTIREDQLDDRHIIRRIILKRCVYGVDLNPMAVELAKLALWLHSFTVGAPLSFLDHHLRCGDSLFGEFAGAVEQDLRARFGLTLSNAIVSARQSAAGMARVEQQTDADIAGVATSMSEFAAVEEITAPLRAFLDLYHAARWLPANGDPAAAAGRDMLFGGGYGDPVAIAAGKVPKPPNKDAVDIQRNGGSKPPIKAADAYAAATRFMHDARDLARDRKFLHWEAGFPGVWQEWQQNPAPGGFDAVIGNPPWDRMKMQEVEWFAARVPAIALAPRAADRKRAIEALRKNADPMASEYDRATWTAEAATRVAAAPGPQKPKQLPSDKPEYEPGAYPLLSGGDVNIYSLMVERATRLVKPTGIIGLLVPSGIAADLGAAPFFKSISTTGRLSALFDFENRRNDLHLPPFFPDVDTRFKFSTLVFGGANRIFPESLCSFFNQSAQTAEASAFALAPKDFAAVNPNTGTAPIFRTPRDAEITKAIYARHPVLVDRRVSPPAAVWPVRYCRMFDMTNDSAKFRTEAELRKLGAYQLQDGTWEKGAAKFVPLYEGKMVQAYDHRAASVTVNPANLHRPAQPEPSGDLMHANPRFRAKPQFFVAQTECGEIAALPAVLAFKDVTAPTNVRTIIAAIMPPGGFGNTLPLLLPIIDGADHPLPSIGGRSYAEWSILLLANLNSLGLDFISRQKVQGQHLNYYIVEQLPFIAESSLSQKFGPKTAAEIIREDVLALTYTAHDLDAFARDLGHTGPPFRWDPEDRLRRRARLDALFFLLYGIARDDADYILSTFPILRAQEHTAYGRFRSRDLILNTMAALAAGQPDAKVAG